MKARSLFPFLYFSLVGCISPSIPDIRDCRDHRSCREYEQKLENYKSFEAEREAKAYKDISTDEAPGIKMVQTRKECGGLIVGDIGKALDVLVPVSCSAYTWQKIVVKVGCKTENGIKFVVPLKGKKVHWEYEKQSGDLSTDLNGNLIFHHMMAEDFEISKLSLKYEGYLGKPDKQFTWEMPMSFCGKSNSP